MWQVAGFKYTDANKASGVIWTTQAMYDYLQNPKKYIKGTNMAFPGFKKEQDRADVVAYLVRRAPERMLFAKPLPAHGSHRAPARRAEHDEVNVR